MTGCAVILCTASWTLPAFLLVEREMMSSSFMLRLLKYGAMFIDKYISYNYNKL